MNVHLGQLALRATRNLLCPELDKLLLQFIELLPQLLLVLAPELRCLNFAGRLPYTCSSAFRIHLRAKIMPRAPL